jgi:3-hydroxyisobutyrate dehydrogenase
MATAGVIGLGEIGAGVALCLARVGLLSAVYDIRKDASKGLKGVPEVAASPAQVAQHADVIIIAVVSAEQTVDVLSGADGVLSAARPGLSVVLLATVGLEDLARIRKLTDAAGVTLIDCGVAGGLKAAENGIVCLVGAKDEDLARVRPVLEGFAKYVAHMGGPGAGMAAKIARNVVIIGSLRAGHEAAELAKAAGVDVRQLIQVLKDSVYPERGPMLFRARPGDPLTDPAEAKIRESMRKMIVKDMDAALELARKSGLRLPLVELTRETSYEVVGISKCGSDRERPHD